MRDEDKRALKIYEILRRAHGDMEERFDPMLNLVGLFMHDLMVYVTGFDLFGRGNGAPQPPGRVDLPWIGTSYVRKTPIVVSEQGTVVPPGWKESVFCRLSGLVARKRPRVVVSIGIRHRGVGTSLFSEFGLRAVRADSCWVPDAELQLATMRGLLAELASFVDARRPGRFIANFEAYVRAQLAEDPPEVEGDVLIAGPGTDLGQRIMRTRYLAAGKPVIALAHSGQAMEIFDEPFVGYGELSYCSVYVSYGSVDPGAGRYNRPLGTSPIVQRRDSQSVRRLHSQRTIDSQRIDRSTRLLYLPTSYVSLRDGRTIRYGPFRDMSDDLYVRWQQALCDAPLSIWCRPHPTSLSGLVLWDNLETRPIKQCLHDYDAVILDYVSTASALAVGSDLPIMFFDLGLRNLRPIAWQALQERCHVVPVDLEDDLADVIGDAVASWNSEMRVFSNRYTPAFSCTDGQPSWSEIVEVGLEWDASR
jgi:hypothetical protein